MIGITPTVAISEDEVSLAFVLASGPGGQNVNKVATAVQLRFDVSGSPSLPHEVKDRLTRLAGRRLSGEGVLTMTARRYRSQERNRQDAIERLTKLIRRACEPRKPRKRTRPTRRSIRLRLDTKRKIGVRKRLRGADPLVDE